MEILGLKGQGLKEQLINKEQIKVLFWNYTKDKERQVWFGTVGI